MYLMDDEGTRLGFVRLPEGIEGVARLHAMVAEHASDPAGVVVGIEADRGLWVGALVGAGYQVYAINPMAVSRLVGPSPPGRSEIRPRGRQGIGRPGASDRHNHRQVAAGCLEAAGLRVLARTHQNLIWARVRHINQIRNALREYYVAALKSLLRPGRSRHPSCAEPGTHTKYRCPPDAASDPGSSQSGRTATQPQIRWPAESSGGSAPANSPRLGGSPTRTGPLWEHW